MTRLSVLLTALILALAAPTAASAQEAQATDLMLCLKNIFSGSGS